MEGEGCAAWIHGPGRLLVLMTTAMETRRWSTCKGTVVWPGSFGGQLCLLELTTHLLHRIHHQDGLHQRCEAMMTLDASIAIDHGGGARVDHHVVGCALRVVFGTMGHPIRGHLTAIIVLVAGSFPRSVWPMPLAWLRRVLVELCWPLPASRHC